MSTIINLDELIRQGKNIYVKNNANIAGKFLINFSDPHSNRVETVIIPRTYLPINLNQFVTPDMIRGSYDLRSWVSKGLLTLISEEDAEAELNDPENKEELKRLFVSEFSKDASAYSNKLHEAIKVEPIKPETAITFGDSTEEGVTITPRILSFVEKLFTEELSVHNGLQELKIMEKQKELTVDDCNYMINELGEGQVKNAVQKIRAAFVGEEFNEDSPTKSKRGRPSNK